MPKSKRGFASIPKEQGRAIARLGGKAGHDTQTNVQAAHELGIKSLLYHNPNQLIKGLNELGVTV